MHYSSLYYRFWGRDNYHGALAMVDHVVLRHNRSHHHLSANGSKIKALCAHQRVRLHRHVDCLVRGTMGSRYLRVQSTLNHRRLLNGVSGALRVPGSSLQPLHATVRVPDKPQATPLRPRHTSRRLGRHPRRRCGHARAVDVARGWGLTRALRVLRRRHEPRAPRCGTDGGLPRRAGGHLLRLRYTEVRLVGGRPSLRTSIPGRLPEPLPRPLHGGHLESPGGARAVPDGGKLQSRGAPPGVLGGPAPWSRPSDPRTRARAKQQRRFAQKYVTALSMLFYFCVCVCCCCPREQYHYDKNVKTVKHVNKKTPITCTLLR